MLRRFDYDAEQEPLPWSTVSIIAGGIILGVFTLALMLFFVIKPSPPSMMW